MNVGEGSFGSRVCKSALINGSIAGTDLQHLLGLLLGELFETSLDRCSGRLVLETLNDSGGSEV